MATTTADAMQLWCLLRLLDVRRRRIVYTAIRECHRLYRKQASPVATRPVRCASRFAPRPSMEGK